MAHLTDFRNNNQKYSLTIDGIGTYATVTMADQTGYTAATTGSDGSGSLVEDDGGNYIVELPGNPGKSNLNVSLLIVG